MDAQQFLTNPIVRMGLGMLQGEAPTAGLKEGLQQKALLDAQEARRQEALRAQQMQALMQGMEAPEGIDPALFRLNPELALKAADYQRKAKKDNFMLDALGGEEGSAGNMTPEGMMRAAKALAVVDPVKAKALYDMAMSMPQEATPKGSGDGALPPPSKRANPKIQGEVDKAITIDELKNLNEVASGAQRRLGLLDQAETALSNLPTGAFTELQGDIANIPLLGELAGGQEFAAKVQAAEAPIKAIAKTYRVKGEGSSSDRDVELLLKSAPSVNNQPQANEIIIAGTREQAKRDIDYATTINDLYNRGYSLAEAKKIYKEYADKNPIMAEDGSGLNPNRIDSFDAWVDAGMPDNSGKKAPEKKGASGGDGWSIRRID